VAVIAVYSVKGGVGKTTIAVDLAWRAASIGAKQTLLWDLDPQGGAGFLLGLDPPKTSNAVGLFQHTGKPRDRIETTRFDNLSIIQADMSLRNLPLQLARMGSQKRLSTMLSFLRADFPRIVLDCPPMLGELSDQIMHAADLIVLPLPASPLAKRAFDQMREELHRNHRNHPPVLPVLSMYDSRRKLHRETRATGAANWPMIPQSSLIEQVASRNEPIASFANWSDPSRALGRLWSAVEMKLVELGRG